MIRHQFAILMFLSVALAWIIYWCFAKDIPGEFGDAFGALNTLFTGLAFAGLAISIRLQSIELKETRDQIKIQAEESIKQTISFQKQTNIITKQSFEQTFFSMIDLLSKTRNSISLRVPSSGSSGKHYEGIEVMAFIAESLDSGLNIYTNEEVSKKRFDELYQYCDYVKIMGHYFQSIYQIVKSIDRHDALNEKEKKFYISILRAFFSQDELKAIFYNGISPFGRNKFKPLLEKYNMLEHIFFVNYDVKEEIIDSLIIKYEIEAFGSNEKIKERYSKASSS